MLLTNTQLQEVIPHRAPMILIDRLLRVTDDTFETGFFIPADHLFLRDGFLTETALLENMAQSCAAGFGYQARGLGVPPKPGYIGAISRVQVFGLPRAGALIHTSIRVLHRMDPVVMVHGVCYRDGEKLVEGELKLVI